MNAKNRYYRRSRISEKKFRQLLRCFAMDLTATVTATLTGISVRSINSIYLKLRSRIAISCEQQSPLRGAVEVDESYFGPRHVKGKRGCGAYGKKAIRELLPLQAGDVQDTFADVSALIRQVGYKPSTTIKQGVSNFVSWYRAYYKI